MSELVRGLMTIVEICGFSNYSYLATSAEADRTSKRNRVNREIKIDASDPLLNRDKRGIKWQINLVQLFALVTHAM